jgi:chemotaxis protein histidine kinase CheA
MSARPLVLGILVTLISVFAARDGRAESQQAVDKIVALNKSAIAAFTAGDHEKAKSQLLEAVVLGKENGLGMHAAMARTYVHLGVIYVDGLKDKEKGVRYFGMAQKVRPDIELTPTLASKTVVAAFQEAKGDAAKGDKTAKAEAKPEAKPEAKAVAKAEPKPAVKEEAKPAPDKKKEAAEAHAREEADKLQKDLAQARESEKKERAEKERLQKALAEKDKALAEKDKALAEKDKALAEKDKQLAEAKAGEKKEHEAREKLEKSGQESAKAIAEAAAREKKEHEAREKLEKEKQLADQHEKERKDRETQERAAREKLVEGPDLPGSIPQPLYCAGMDEAVVGTELFVHCVPQGQVKARSVVLYYRTAGVAHFDALTMARSKKGWWTTSIPAVRVTGKTLQYYAEARGPKDDVAASNGKSDSPNIVVLRTSAAAVAKTDPAALDKTAPAPRKTAAKRTIAGQKVKARH